MHWKVHLHICVLSLKIPPIKSIWCGTTSVRGSRDPIGLTLHQTPNQKPDMLWVFSFQLPLLHPDYFLRNLFSILRFEAERNIDKLRKPVDMDKWATRPAVVNAFYNPNKNDIGKERGGTDISIESSISSPP